MASFSQARTGITTNAAVPQRPVRETASGTGPWFATLLEGSQSAPAFSRHLSEKVGETQGLSILRGGDLLVYPSSWHQYEELLKLENINGRDINCQPPLVPRDLSDEEMATLSQEQNVLEAFRFFVRSGDENSPSRVHESDSNRCPGYLSIKEAIKLSVDEGIPINEAKRRITTCAQPATLITSSATRDLHSTLNDQISELQEQINSLNNRLSKVESAL